MSLEEEHQTFTVVFTDFCYLCVAVCVCVGLLVYEDVRVCVFVIEDSVKV